MRLIDADEFKAQHDWLLHCDFPYLTEATLEELIDDAPTVDAVPVRHGRWKVAPVYIKCSECGESFMLMPQNYCPNCGARMDGERRE